MLQGGRVLAAGKLRRYEPFCEIEVDDVAETPQFVRPGRFAVMRVVRQRELGALDPTQKPAAHRVEGGIGGGVEFHRGGGFYGFGIGTRFGMFGDAPLALYALRLRLKSEAQPNVRELRCAAGWALLPDAVYPTLAEMRGALGALATIETQ